MTKFILPICAVMALAACQDAGKPETNGSAAEPTASIDTAADDKAIRAQVDRWLELIKAKDAAAIAGLYAVDGAVMPPNAPIAKGQAAIQQTWAGMMATPGFDLDIVPDQIIVSASGDMALDRGTYTLAMAPGGAKQTDVGKYVVVWRKIDGEWKAAADIFNSDRPASGG